MKKILFLLLVMALIPGSHPELFAQKKSRKAEVAAEAAVFTEGERAKWRNIIALGHLPVFTD